MTLPSRNNFGPYQPPHLNYIKVALTSRNAVKLSVIAAGKFRILITSQNDRRRFCFSCLWLSIGLDLEIRWEVRVSLVDTERLSLASTEQVSRGTTLGQLDLAGLGGHLVKY